MKKYLRDAYDTSICIVSTGHSFKFYKNLSRRPSEFPQVSNRDRDYHEYLVEHNYKFVTDNDWDELVELMYKDNKAFLVEDGYNGLTKWRKELILTNDKEFYEENRKQLLTMVKKVGN